MFFPLVPVSSVCYLLFLRYSQKCTALFNTSYPWPLAAPACRCGIHVALRSLYPQSLAAPGCAGGAYGAHTLTKAFSVFLIAKRRERGTNSGHAGCGASNPNKNLPCVTMCHPTKFHFILVSSLGRVCSHINTYRYSL